MEYSEDLERIIESDDADNGWVDTHHYDPNVSSLEDKISEMTLDNAKVSEKSFSTKNQFSICCAQIFRLKQNFNHCHYQSARLVLNVLTKHCIITNLFSLNHFDP